MTPEFLVAKKESMKEHPLRSEQRKDISYLSENQESEGFRVVVFTNDVKKVIPIGAAWFDGKNWLAVMGSCWVGTYKKWQDAMDNIIIAYFG